MKKYGVLLLAAMIMINLPMAVRAKESVPNTLELDEITAVGTYTEYLEEHGAEVTPGSRILIQGSDYVDCSGEVRRERLGDASLEAAAGGEDSSITWECQVPEAGLYQILISYYPMEGKGGNIERRILINGELPFSGAGAVTFYRNWTVEREIEQDLRGNDIRPLVREERTWMEDWVKDSTGIFGEPYLFYLEKGKNTITLEAVKEPAAIGSLTLCRQDEPVSYEQLAQEYAAQGYTPADTEGIIIQGELPAYVTNASLYAVSDKSSPATQDKAGRSYEENPDRIAKTVLNCIGGENWKWSGQAVTWEVEVQESGLYWLGIKYKQNYTTGMDAYRRLLVDGELPFAQARSLTFPYSADWENLIMEDGDGNPQWIWLEAGRHTISLEVTIPEKLGGILARVNTCVTRLNQVYRELLVLIGTTPDTRRDYNLKTKAAGAIALLGEQHRELKEIYEELQALYGGAQGMDSSALEQLIYQTGRMYEKESNIPGSWSSFKDNIVAMSSWAMSMQQQPLLIDYLQLGGAKIGMKPAESSVFGQMGYELRRFFSSFTEDYTTIGDSGEGLTVWVLSDSAGRDQAQILRNMIDEDFTPGSGISVNIQLVSSSVMLSAVLAGRGPDVALHVGNSEPVNYALRNAVCDLTQFEDFDETAERFYKESLVPYEFNGAVYALPETMDFMVMFYRADILAQLGVKIPVTWEDFYVAASIIQNNNMQVGLPVGGTSSAGVAANASGAAGNLIGAYNMFLAQAGCGLYAEDGKSTNLTSEKAVEAFRMWTAMFTDYNLPVAYDLANRFRTGEMPLAVSNYTSYNYLSVFAPEIKGLWGFTLVPGTEREDGSIDHTSSISGSACFILEACSSKDQAWEFLKWWTCAEAQEEYGSQIENLLGPSGRLATANVEAMEKLPWTKRELEVLKTQLESVAGIEEVPGGYMTSRHIMNAFYSVYNNNENPREVLEEYALTINNEITNKRIEFGMED